MNYLLQVFLNDSKRLLNRHRVKVLDKCIQVGVCSERLNLSSIARELYISENGKTSSFLMKLKQLHRFCRMEEPIITELSRQWFRFITRKMKLVVVSLDWTQFGDQWVLVSSVVCMGRAIPFWHISLPLHDRKDRETLCEESLLLCISSFFWPTQKVIIVADRGFGKTSLIRFATLSNFEFICRLKTNVHFQWEGLQCQLHDLQIHEGEYELFSNAFITRQKIPCTVMALWNPEKAEPIYLAGSSKSITLLDKLYALRPNTECLFRDCKYRANLHWSRFKALTRSRSWFFVVSMILTYRALLVQHHAEAGKEWMRPYKDGRRDLSFYQLGIWLSKNMKQLEDGCVYLPPEGELEMMMLNQ